MRRAPAASSSATVNDLPGTPAMKLNGFAIAAHTAFTDARSGKPGAISTSAGIDTIDMTAISSDVFSANHSGYAEKAVVLDDIQTLIRTGQRPPEKRLP